MTGIEARLVRSWATRLGARIEWVEGAETSLIEALRFRQLDLVIGGLTDDTPWRSRVGMSQPFASVAVVVGDDAAVSPAASPRGIRGTAVSYPGTRPHFAALIAAAHAVPAPVPAGERRSGAAAAYDFELDRLGRRSMGVVLARERHVMAVTPGENALLFSLDRFLAPMADRAPVPQEAEP